MFIQVYDCVYPDQFSSTLWLETILFHGRHHDLIDPKNVAISKFIKELMAMAKT